MRNHDPLDRQQDGEPRFCLLGRDWSAPYLIRIWVAIRRRDPSLIDAIVKNIKAKMETRPYHPKDAEHVVSASSVATSMDLWLIDRSHTPLDVEGTPV